MDCKNLQKKESDELTLMEKYKNVNSSVAFGKVKNLTDLPTGGMVICSMHLGRVKLGRVKLCRTYCLGHAR
jgi:hypothetical protein